MAVIEFKQVSYSLFLKFEDDLLKAGWELYGYSEYSKDGHPAYAELKREKQPAETHLI